MSVFKVALAAGVAGAALAAQPAGAVITTFATFSVPNANANFRFVNTGNSSVRTTDATYYTTATKTATTPGTALVRFSFLQPQFAAYVTNTTAAFTLNGTVAKNSTVTNTAGFLLQQGVSGSFSFLSTTAITVGGPLFIPHTYAAGSNLLSGTFSKGVIGGSGSSGSESDSNVAPGSMVTFTSDFLDFTPTVERDLSLALSSIVPSLSQHAGVNRALSTFRAVAGGQFSSDPAPLINGIVVVPEPGVWVLMIAGFGLVGVSTRRRGGVVAA